MNVEEKFSLRKFLKGFVSKKMIIWVIATVALFMKLIDGTWWGIITAAYLGVNVTQDYIMRKLGGKNGISNSGAPAGGEYRGLGGAASPAESAGAEGKGGRSPGR